MSIPNTRRMKRRPTHPGEMLGEDFLPDFKLTVAGLADAEQAIKSEMARIKPLRVA